MQFSVIIPTFNRARLLKQAIDSVRTQTCRDYEIIVVDDGSTDGTVDYLASLGDHVRIRRQANRGPGAARNLGAQEARGQYLAFLDSDDVWFPWTLASFREVIARYDRPSLVCARTMEFQGPLPRIEQQ